VTSEVMVAGHVNFIHTVGRLTEQK